MPETNTSHVPHHLTAGEVLDRVQAIRIHAYDETTLLQRLHTLEAMLLTEVHFAEYPQTLERETLLCAELPYCEIYEQYLFAQLDLLDMELAQYNNGMQIFQNTYSEYAARVRREKRPAPGKQVTGYD